MSDHNPIEKCGGLTVYHPVKAEVIQYADWFKAEWEGVDKWHKDWNAVEAKAA